MVMYTGIVVEEALDNNLLINKLEVDKVIITNALKKEDRWHMYQVRVSDDIIDVLANHIIEGWYIHFWKGEHIIALMGQGKKFEFEYNKKDTWNEVLKYGISQGIPIKQLDFPICGL